jgi:hypothetical protein
MQWVQQQHYLQQHRQQLEQRLQLQDQESSFDSDSYSYSDSDSSDSDSESSESESSDVEEPLPKLELEDQIAAALAAATGELGEELSSAVTEHINELHTTKNNNDSQDNMKTVSGAGATSPVSRNLSTAASDEGGISGGEGSNWSEQWRGGHVLRAPVILKPGETRALPSALPPPPAGPPPFFPKPPSEVAGSNYRPVRQRSARIVIETADSGSGGLRRRSTATLNTPTRPTAIQQMSARNNSSKHTGGFGRGLDRRRPPHHIEALTVDIPPTPWTPGTPTTTSTSSYRTPTPTAAGKRRRRLPSIIH